jgi:hypothetical protein
MSDPVRRCRRLLIAYPRDYRKQRGEEIIDTLAESSASPVSEAFALVAGGLRCRLGRPHSRLVVVFSLLTALLVGLLGAALTNRLAWESAGPLPSNDAALRVFALVAPGSNPGAPKRADHTFGYATYGSLRSVPLADSILRMLFADGWEEYGPGEVHVADAVKSTGNTRLYLERAAARLRAEGWQVTPNWYDPSLTARKPSTVLQVFAYPGVPGGSGSAEDPAPGSAGITMDIYRTRPSVVVPAEIAGGVVGGTFAWLVFGWTSRRTWRLGGQFQPWVWLLNAGMVLMWLPPSGMTVARVWFDSRRVPSESGIPNQELFTSLLFPSLMPLLIGAGAAVLLTAIAASRPRAAAAVAVDSGAPLGDENRCA